MGWHEDTHRGWSDCIDHGRSSAPTFGYANQRAGELYRPHQVACSGYKKGLVAHHMCLNQRCINPDHLVAMTHSQHWAWHAAYNHRTKDHLPRPGKGKSCLDCARQAMAKRRAADPMLRDKAQQYGRRRWARQREKPGFLAAHARRENERSKKRRRTDEEYRVRMNKYQLDWRHRKEAANGEG